MSGKFNVPINVIEPVVEVEVRSLKLYSNLMIIQMYLQTASEAKNVYIFFILYRIS